MSAAYAANPTNPKLSLNPFYEVVSLILDIYRSSNRGYIRLLQGRFIDKLRLLQSSEVVAVTVHQIIQLKCRPFWHRGVRPQQTVRLELKSNAPLKLFII